MKRKVLIVSECWQSCLTFHSRKKIKKYLRGNEIPPTFVTSIRTNAFLRSEKQTSSSLVRLLLLILSSSLVL